MNNLIAASVGANSYGGGGMRDLGALNFQELFEQRKPNLFESEDQGLSLQQLVSKFFSVEEGTVKQDEKIVTPPTDMIGKAPTLYRPDIEMAPDDLALHVFAVTNKLSATTFNAALVGAKVNQANQVDMRARARKLEESMRAAQADAASRGKFSSVFGWITKAATVVGAALGVVVTAASTAATGGLGTPLMLLATAAFIGATMQLAGDITKAAGVGDISLSSGVSSLFSKLLMTAGMEEGEANKWGKVIPGLLVIALAVTVSPMIGVAIVVDPNLLANSIGGIAGLAGGSKELSNYLAMGTTLLVTLAVCVATASLCAANTASSAKVVTRKLVTVGSHLHSVAQATSGATGVAAGAFAISSAKSQYAADNASADRSSLRASMVRLSRMIENEQERLERIVYEASEAVSGVTAMLNTIYSTSSEIRKFQRTARA